MVEQSPAVPILIIAIRESVEKGLRSCRYCTASTLKVYPADNRRKVETNVSKGRKKDKHRTRRMEQNFEKGFMKIFGSRKVAYITACQTLQDAVSPRLYGQVQAHLTSPNAKTPNKHLHA